MVRPSSTKSRTLTRCSSSRRPCSRIKETQTPVSSAVRKGRGSRPQCWTASARVAVTKACHLGLEGSHMAARARARQTWFRRWRVSQREFTHRVQAGRPRNQPGAIPFSRRSIHPKKNFASHSSVAMSIRGVGSVSREGRAESMRRLNGPFAFSAEPPRSLPCGSKRAYSAAWSSRRCARTSVGPLPTIIFSIQMRFLSARFSP